MAFWKKKTLAGGGTRRIAARLGAITAAVAIAAALLVPSAAIFAAGISDGNTSQDYSWSLGNKSSTRYNGRVWTDKSVSTEDVKFTGDAGETVTVPIGEGNDASDFLVTYSALATSQQVSGESNVPVDVVFVIDLSGSMSNNNSFMDNGQKRIQNLVTALNTAVNELMEMNPDNRIGVVGYESTAMTILPLDHYTPSGYNQNIFSYSDGNKRLSWDATNSSNQRVSDNTNVSGGTNTQMGIYQGMNMLATEADTTVTLAGGQEVNRVPSVIVMADGAATYSSNSSAWWSPSNNNNNGPGGDAYYGNGMKAMMTAAYMKQAIDRNYQPTDDAYKATVYTIGIGTDYLRGSEKNLAYITLNPKDHWNDDNSMANSIRNKWNGVDSEWGEWFDEEGYLSNNGTGTPDINVDSRETYRLTHPQQYDITEVGLQYNDAYYDAITAEDINTIFADIVDSISLGTPQVPTKVEGSNPVESGYITYTDVIGDYMEVDSVKTLLWAGKEFKNPQVSGEGTDDVTYTFEGEIQNPAYENAQNANQIQITVHTNTAADGTKTQTLTVKIPATAIPLRVNTVELSENAQGETTVVNVSNNAYPLRLVYGVSLQDGIDATTLEGVSDDYIKANTQDGKVNFYSNKYSGQMQGGKTVGDAKVEFTPADNNPFYFLQEDTPIYTSQTGNDRVTRDDFNENATYWVPITYYDGNQIVNTRVQRAASTMTGYIGYEEEGSGWGTTEYAYIKAGAPRLGNLTDAVRNKTSNTTGTAETSLYPTFEGNDVHNGKFVVYLGNNGKLQLDAPASLIIAKDVTADEGLTAPGATFTFEVTSAAKAGSTVSATITTGSGQTATTEDTTVQFNDDGVATVTLKADQSIELKGMAGAGYSIKETNLPSGFDFNKVEGADQTSGSGNDTVASGTVQTGAEDETVTFTNNYSVKSVTSKDLNINLGGTKTIDGRTFQEDDTFTFTIAAGRLTPDAPLPSATEGGKDSVTITPNSGDSATFEFDPITFTEPGEYCYIIRETDPTASGTTPEAGLGGVDYDTAVYRISVVIVDNGDGTLRLATTDEIAGMETQVENYTSNPMLQELEGTGMTGAEVIQFDNSYNSESTTATIQGMKVLNVTNSDYRLQDGDFTFKIEALGSNTDGGDQFTADETQPMPVDQNGDELTQTKNVANGNVLFDFADDVFTQDMVGKTFGYKITEVNPSPEGSIMSNGVTYDTSEQIVKISVADDGQGNVIAQVTPNTADEGDPAVNFTFTNSYEPEEITIGDQTNAGITVQKTFTGHEWTDDYNFEYTLKAVSNTAGIETDKMPMPGETTLSIANPESGAVNTNAFDEMTFERAGEYVYEITETDGDHGGVTYDGHTAKVTVVVSENAETGRLSAAIQYDNSTASEADKDVEGAAAFTNTYDATFDASTAVNLDGTKNLTVGGNSTRTLGAGQFYAVVTALDGAPLGDAGVAPGSTTYNIANTADDSADNGVFTGSFEDLLNNITFKLSDLNGAASREFVYLISEQQGNATGVTYDQSVYQVTVSVTDDGKGTLSADEPQIVKGTMQDGQFVANESQDGVNGVVFNNSYAPTSGTYAPLKITKVLSGDRITGLQQGEFSFEMSVTSADPKDGITLPQQTVVENSADGSVQFGNITFTKAGTYVVQVKEVVPAEDSGERVSGVTYDEHVIKTTFTVTDDNGQLKVNRTGSTGSTTFTNEYTSTGTTDAALSGTKYISGRDFMKGDTFTFDIAGTYEGTAENVTAPLPENVTASEDNAAQGTIAITPESGLEQAINFGDITFTKPGTYSYTLSEQDVSEAVVNVTKDSTVYTVTYTVTDNGDGTMTVSGPAYAIQGAEEGAEAPTALSWTNTYNPTEITTGDDINTGIQVTKKVTGHDAIEAFEFSLKLKEGQDASHVFEGSGDSKTAFDGMTLTTSSDLKADETETKTFGDITFTAKGDYVFVIDETTEKSDQGWTYDTSTHEVTVHVKDNTQTGALYIDSISDNNPTFENVYKLQPTMFRAARFQLQGNKVLDGRNWEAGDEFTFTLTPGVGTNVDGTPMSEADVKATMPVKQSDTIKPFEDDSKVTDNSAQFTFTSDRIPSGSTVEEDTFTYTKPGTYRYLIRETNPNASHPGSGILGVSYDQTVYRLTVTVTDNGDGTMSATSAYSVQNEDNSWTDLGGSDQITFTNKYSSDQVNVTFNAFKVLQNRDQNMKDNEFMFHMEFAGWAANDANADPNTDTDWTMDDTTKAPNAAPDKGNIIRGDVTFGDVTFTSDNVGYTYRYKITENTGTVPGVTYDTSAKYVTAKVTSVQQANDDGTFTEHVRVDTSGEAEWNSQTNTAPTTGAIFTNTYKAGETTDVPAGFEFTKQFTGHEWTDNYSFVFTLAAQDSELADGTPVAAANVPMPVNATKTVNAPDEEAGDTATFDFGSISYDKAGTYNYTVTETHAGETLNGITYDAQPAQVTVTVTEGKDDSTGELTGQLVATATVTNDDFVNEYNTSAEYNTSGVGGLDITKQVTNHTMAENQFSFTIKATGNNADAAAKKLGIQDGTTVTVESAQAAAGVPTSVKSNPFETVKFDKSDDGVTYTYIIGENGTTGEGEYKNYVLDDTTYEVEITATDNGDGTMSVKTVVNGTEYVDRRATAAFENSYKADPTTVGAKGAATIEGTKTLKNDTLAASQFTFQVKSGDVVVAEGSNDDNGNITFGDITYTTENLAAATTAEGSSEVGKVADTPQVTDEGTVYKFNYVVSEVTPDKNTGVTASSSAQNITITVTDDGNGTLTPKVTYGDGDPLAFENVYGGDAEYLLDIAGTKEIVGAQDNLNVPALTADAYEFTIVGHAAADGTPAPMPDVITVGNDASGNVTFEDITYTMENTFGNKPATTDADTEAAAEEAAADEVTTDEGIETYTAGRTQEFTYTISESGSVDGVTNEQGTKLVEVTVTDLGGGDLKAEVTSVKTAEGADFKFTNVYDVEPEDSSLTGDGGFTITKDFTSTNTDRGLSEGEFEFQLKSGDDVVATAKNEADGTVSFDNITFTKPGTYSYVLSEVNSGEPGVDYDTTSYNVTATAKDNGDGTLEVTWEMPQAMDDAVTFENTYTAENGSITLRAAKVLQGRDLTDGEFTFELRENGKVIDTATNNAVGEVVFNTIEYTEPGEHDYEIVEVAGAAEGVTYDTTVHTMHVSVTDNIQTGTLAVAWAYGENGAPVFTNTYTAPEVPVEPSDPGEPAKPADNLPVTGDYTLPIVGGIVVAGAALIIGGRMMKKRGE